ncbi:hypothetical protein K8I85_10095, partial [bacterium]|nr:hypothetical protein [bacterium]
VLGGALALAFESDDNGDTVRWSFVGGTLFGFGYGVYHVSTRPQPRAALEHGPGGWALAMPTVQWTSERAPETRPMLPGADRRDVTVRATLASVGF